MNSFALELLAVVAVAGAHSDLGPSQTYRQLNTAQEQRQALYLRITQAPKAAIAPDRAASSVPPGEKD